MAIIWRGWVFLAIVIPVILGVPFALWLGDGRFGLGVAIGFLLSAAPLWILGRKLNPPVQWTPPRRNPKHSRSPFGTL